MISLGAGEYKVQPGDTLSKIAEAQLGDANLWKEIADLNGIKKTYVVKVGQTLSIPNYEDEHESIEEN
ncbi:MAG: LysM peptidoglycan-binding domain-containing protein [Lentisphaerales bacterium]|nr:LysM peptidoglycan-binding domain-containing protein [Lentisphaerales bacterium]